MSTTEIPRRFQDLLRSHLPYADAGELSASDPLAALGLDSMSIVAMLVAIEDDYDIELPDELIDEDTFETVGSLWQAVSPLVEAGRC